EKRSPVVPPEVFGELADLNLPQDQRPAAARSSLRSAHRLSGSGCFPGRPKSSLTCSTNGPVRRERALSLASRAPFKLLLGARELNLTSCPAHARRPGGCSTRRGITLALLCGWKVTLGDASVSRGTAV